MLRHSSNRSGGGAAQHPQYMRAQSSAPAPASAASQADRITLLNKANNGGRPSISQPRGAIQAARASAPYNRTAYMGATGLTHKSPTNNIFDLN